MKNKALPALFGLLVTGSSIFGGLGGPHSLPDLEQNADLIVIGTASGSFLAGAAANFSLQVSRVVSGDATLAGSVIPVSWAAGNLGTAPAGTTLTAAGSGLWFLKHSSGTWLLLPVVDGAISASMTFIPEPEGAILSAYAYSPTASLSDRVASEICSAIESASGPLPPQLSGLEYGLLDQLNSPVVALHFQRLSTSASPQQQALGLAGLVRAGSGTALATAAQAASVFGGYPLQNGILMQGVRDYFRAADAGSIATLGAVATDTSSANTAFREAAAHALAAIHTVAALPYLAALFDDPDAALRVEAIGGMGAFANGLPIQTPAGVPSLAHLRFPASAPYLTAATRANFALGSQAIEQNEASYLTFWKQWWSQQKVALGF